MPRTNLLAPACVIEFLGTPAGIKDRLQKVLQAPPS